MTNFILLFLAAGYNTHKLMLEILDSCDEILSACANMFAGWSGDKTQGNGSVGNFLEERSLQPGPIAGFLKLGERNARGHHLLP
jgi:hypothetical protein